MLTITPDTIPALLDLAVKTQLTPYFEGPPGVGKTEIIQSYAESHGFTFLSELLNQTDSVTLKGLTLLDMASSPPATHEAMPPLIKKANSLKKPVFLLLDEITTALPSTQSAMLTFIDTHTLNGFPLPKNTFIAMAGNSIEDSVDVQPLIKPLEDRVVYYKLKPDFPSWDIYMRNRSSHPHMAILLGALESMQDHFTSPRSWTKVADFLEIIPKNQFYALTTKATIQGLVTPEAATKLYALLTLAEKLPTPKEIFTHPKTTRLPDPNDRQSQCLAISVCLSLLQNKTSSTDSIITYMGRLPTSITTAFVVAALKNPETQHIMEHNTDFVLKYAATLGDYNL